MAIDIGKSLVSVGIGVVDEVLERQDALNDRTESFKTWSDIGRLVGAAAGYGIQAFMPRQEKWGEALALSATPLLVKSIAKPLMENLSGEAKSSRYSFVPRRRVAEQGPSVAGKYRPLT